ncbi:hypothetical protein PR003_g4348 [Phytophthora rubi]|uniref:Uncharacterized protein n=1 Tax=Phytophthora rubi TaxID=129364 RepID=A0A6A3NWJ7_9STRA|nr:hypothetical protein PR002_g2587 [Phytophthora rubi]KAE9047704.1 hypothetical protein PR001_g4099 [Phytophthora rubi]KAE9352516.1 hypothetical protein PR003_g4348 [Phytophthora rubi]
MRKKSWSRSFVFMKLMLTIHLRTLLVALIALEINMTSSPRKLRPASLEKSAYPSVNG